MVNIGHIEGGINFWRCIHLISASAVNRGLELGSSPRTTSRFRRGRSPSCGKVACPCHFAERRSPGRPQEETCDRANAGVWRPAQKEAEDGVN